MHNNISTVNRFTSRKKLLLDLISFTVVFTVFSEDLSIFSYSYRSFFITSEFYHLYYLRDRYIFF